MDPPLGEPGTSKQAPNPHGHGTRSKTAAARAEDVQDELYIVTCRNLTQLFNFSYRAHCTYAPECPGYLLVYKHENRIISSTLFMRCSECDFEGPKVKMYSDMKCKLEDLLSGTETKGKANSGPRHSTLNVALALTLMGTSIDVTQFQEIMCGIGIDPGNEKSLSILMKKAGPLSDKLAQESMDRGIRDLIELQGKGEEVGISFDVLYNNCKNRKGLRGQPATQACGTTIGSNKKTLSTKFKNKLCWKCSKSENDCLMQGKEPQPCNTPGCSRNTAIAATISDEASMLSSTLDDLRSKGLEHIDYCILDGDAKNSNVCKERNIEVGRDAFHINKNLKTKYAAKSAKLPVPVQLPDFDGWNDAEREKDWDDVKADIISRCQAELKAASNYSDKLKLKGKAKLQKMKSLLRCITCAILECHQGRCGKNCKRYSFVCNGKNSYPKYAASRKLSTANQKVVRALVNERLKALLPSTYRNKNTSINEARNTTHIKVLPKTKTSTKNAPSRISRGTLISNEGIAKSSEICNNAIGHRVCQGVKKRYMHHQDRKAYFIEKGKSNNRKSRDRTRVKFQKSKQKEKRGEKLYGRNLENIT